MKKDSQNGLYWAFAYEASSSYHAYGVEERGDPLPKAEGD